LLLWFRLRKAFAPLRPLMKGLSFSPIQVDVKVCY
jgi:hypothetical protein